MFTKLAADITFSDIEDFCREFGEGVRVEYKQEIDIKKHIPKIVSSFANAYGGIFVINETSRKKFDSIKRQECLDSQVLVSTQCLPRDLMEREKFIGVVDQLAGQLLWAFNIDNPTERKELVGCILEKRGLAI